MIWVLLGWALARVELMATMTELGNKWGGFGAINWTLDKTAPAPMRYRVLFPWLLQVVRGQRRLEWYMVLKWAAIVYALWAVSLAWGRDVALVTAALLPLTFWFEYWNWPVELGGLALAFTGNIVLAIIGVILWSLSKETAPLGGLAFYAATGDAQVGAILTVGALTMVPLLRAMQGEAELYCDRVMIGRNLRELIDIKSTSPKVLGSSLSALVLAVLTIGAALTFPTGWYIPIIILAAGWTLAVAAETRVFVGVLPWVAAWVLTW